MTDGIERRFKVAIPILAIFVVFAFGLSAYSFWHGREVSCAQADVTLTVLGDLLRDVRTQALQNTRIDLEQRRAAVRFYDTYLERIQTVRC